ncbi:MAG: hypothetical protein Q9180_008565, partial [Flavoplaca navasiana]
SVLHSMALVPEQAALLAFASQPPTVPAREAPTYNSLAAVGPSHNTSLEATLIPGFTRPPRRRPMLYQNFMR